MKRFKNDPNIHVNNYLKQRHYNLKKYSPQNSSNGGFTMRDLIISNMMDRCNSFGSIYATNINSETDRLFVELVTESFVKLESFVNSNCSPEALRSLIFPCFINFFYRLFENGHEDGARSLFTRFRHLFTLETQLILINAIEATLRDRHSHLLLVKYSSCRQRLNLTKSAHTSLMEFLRGEILLTEQISKSFDFVLESGERSTYNLPSLSGDEMSKGVNNDSNGKSTSLVQLGDSFNQLEALPPSLPYSCIGYLKGTRPSTVDIRSDTKFFAAGFEDSSIHVWPLCITSDLRNDSVIDDPLGFQFDIGESSLVRCSSLTTPSGAFVIRGHFRPIFDLNFVKNTPYLLSCSGDSSVRLWSLEQKQNIFNYVGHSNAVWSIDCSALELYFVTGSKDTTARLWSYERLSPLKVFVGHNSDVDFVKFHPNVSYVATGSTDKTVRFWNIKDGKMMRVLKGHTSRVLCLSFSPDGNYLVSGGTDNLIKVYDIRASKTIASLTGHQQSVTDLTFNGDGTLLISSSHDKTLKYWDFKQLCKNDKEINPLHTLKTDFSLIRVRMLPHNLLYCHGSKI